MKSYLISPACHGKRFVPAGFFFLSSLLITYFITLSLEKEIIVLEKVLNFGSKICTNPVPMFQRKKAMHVSSLGPKSDQHQFSPNNISKSSRVKVMRIGKMITKGKMLWSFIKFYQSKCMEISFENLSVDIGSLKAQHPCFHSPYHKLQILIFFFWFMPACSCLGYKLSNENLVCNFHPVNESYCVFFLFI